MKPVRKKRAAKTNANPNAKPAKLKCQGTTSKGTPCTRNAMKEAKTCLQHTPGYVRNTSKADNDKKSIEILRKLTIKVEKREKLGKYKIKQEYAIEGEPLGEFATNTWMDMYVKKCIKNFTKNDRDNTSLLDVDYLTPDVNNKNYKILKPESVVGLSRRSWQKIGWMLEGDRKTYANLALSCRDLYRVLCEDKIWAYYHPLRSKIMGDGGVLHPLLLMMPFYRIVQFEIPSESEQALQDNDIPTFSQLLEFAKDDMKDLKPREFIQRCGQIQQELMQTLVQKIVADSVYEPSIEGGGIFDDISGKIVVRSHKEKIDFKIMTKHVILDFVVKPPSFKLVGFKKNTWLILKSFSVTQDRKLHEELINSLIGYDGYRIIRFMKY